MKRPLVLVLVCLAFAVIAAAQSRGGNWPTFGGDAKRSGWEGADAGIAKETVQDLQLLWKIKLETQPKPPRSVTPPLILGRLISYRGFKELAFFATSADIVYSIDVDLGKTFWQKHLEYSTREPQATNSTFACPGGLTAMPTMPVPAPGAAGRGAPGAPGPAAVPARGGNPFIGGAASVYAISSDGRLHRLNTSTGDDIAQPVSVLPANARASSLNMLNNVIYTVTSQGCNSWPDAVWAIDLNGDAPKAASFALNGGSSTGIGGPVIGADGTVYVQTADGPFDPASNKWSNTLLALAPRNLQLKQYFTPPDISKNAARDLDMNTTSPIAFTHKNRELIVSTIDGALYVLDSTVVGGDDHRTPLSRTPRIAAVGNADRGVWGALSTWEDSAGARWVFAPVWGSLDPGLKIAGTNGSAPNGSIVAFEVEEQQGKPVLTPAWVSRDLSSPVPPVIANGVVFALSAGEFTVDGRPKTSTHATLYALDAATGKELYSSRNLVPTPAAPTGLTLANGRLYFGGVDGTIYAFGKYMEH